MKCARGCINLAWAPDNIVGVPVNPITGELNTNKNTILYYIKGTEPTTNNELDEFIPTLKEETN